MKIYRESSLERLRSPERLDQAIWILSPLDWLSWTTVSLLFIAGLVWGLMGRIPSVATGHGVLKKTEMVDLKNQQTVTTIFFSVAADQKIKPGMKIFITPGNTASSQNKQVVAKVSQVLSSTSLLSENIQNPASTEVPVIAIIKTASLDWNYLPATSTPITARITVAECAPLSFVLPVLKPCSQ
jgi:hypothetical protein